MLYTIRSIAELKTWLKKHGHEANWHARIGIGRGKCLWLSQKSSERFKSPYYAGEEELPLYPIKLPDSRNAREWWWKIWEGEIVSFRYNQQWRIACIAKDGTWESLSPMHVSRSKDDWKTISERRFRKIVGSKTIDEMIRELEQLGIAVRSIPYDQTAVR